MLKKITLALLCLTATLTLPTFALPDDATPEKSHAREQASCLAKVRFVEVLGEEYVENLELDWARLVDGSVPPEDPLKLRAISSLRFK